MSDLVGEIEDAREEIGEAREMATIALSCAVLICVFAAGASMGAVAMVIAGWRL